MTKKDVAIFFGFVVAPLGFFAAGVYYGPKIQKWYVARKQKGTEEIKKENDNGATK